MSDQFPIWNSNYDRMGVSPLELYMRQNGLCWLEIEGKSLYCTDGIDKEKTSSMLNPTFECVKCMSSYTERILENEFEKNKHQRREDPNGDAAK